MFFSFVNNDTKYNLLNKNFYQSLKNVGLEKKIKFIQSSCPGGNYGDIGLRDMCMERLDVTRYYLNKRKIVFFSDTDIVFLNNPIPFLLKLLNNHELLIQDNDNYIESKKQFCAGFYMVKPTKRTIRFFDNKERVDFILQFNSDQEYLFSKYFMDETHWKGMMQLLSLEKFPCGKYWFNKFKNIPKDQRKKEINKMNPFIVHYNWIIGVEKKLTAIKSFNHWFVNNDYL